MLVHSSTNTEVGFEVGYHMSNKYIDPMSYNPNYVDVFRTTLIQNAEGQWEMVEFCEDVGKMLDCDVEFEIPGMRGVITILTMNDVVPEAMGFQLEDEYPRSMRPEQREQAEQEFEEVRRAPVEDMVVEQQTQEAAAVASPAAEEKLDEIVVEPFDVTSVTVNGIELNAMSTLASLRAACGFHSLSTSGSKVKCYRM
jgi:hypothetical protein